MADECGSALFDEKVIVYQDDRELNKTFKDGRQMGARSGKARQLGADKTEKHRLRTIPWSTVRRRLRARWGLPVK